MARAKSEGERATARLRREVARSVDAPAALLPHFDALFRGMPSLGSSPGRVVSMLDRAGIGPKSRVVDLACGKGTLAIALARRLGCTVIGVDACAPFIAEANDATDRAGVSDRVQFIEMDVRVFARGRREAFDGALMMGLFPIEVARQVLRPLVAPGGCYVIDDVFRDERLTANERAFDEIPTKEETRALLERGRDRVVEVDLPPPSRVRSMDAALYRRLRSNAKCIGREHPGVRAALATFLANQRGANRLLGRELRPAVWVVRRGQ